MSHTYTINNTTANTSTITLNSGAGYSNPVTITNVGAGGLGGSIGGAGQIYTTSGTGTTNWATPKHNFVSNNGTPLMTVPANTNEVVLEKTATLDVKGNVRINGIDLEERLKTIEKVLNIPERDAIMEAKYPSLKKKYDEYINLLGKYRTFEAIKGNDE